MRMFLFTLLSVLLINTSIAQTHNELWLKYNLLKKITPKFSASLDINFRQQANYLSNSKNLLQLPLMRSSRLWLFYNLHNNYSILGTLFIAKTFDLKNADADLTNATETQFALGVLKKILLKKNGEQKQAISRTKTN